jgi:hypothetical protein
VPGHEDGDRIASRSPDDFDAFSAKLIEVIASRS